MTIEQYLALITAISAKDFSDLLTLLLEENSAKLAKMQSLYNRYATPASSVPIYSRTFTDETKINNKLVHDYFSSIIETKTGYLFGKPIAYTVNKEAEKADLFNENIWDFLETNRIEILDKRTGRNAAFCGSASRLLYIGEDAKVQAMHIPPWETIFIQDRSIDEVQYTMCFYSDATPYSKEVYHRMFQYFSVEKIIKHLYTLTPDPIQIVGFDAFKKKKI